MKFLAILTGAFAIAFGIPAWQEANADDEPPAAERESKMFVPVIVNHTYQGKNIRWWAGRAVHNRKVIKRLGRQLQVVREKLWKARLKAALVPRGYPPHFQEWLCIHSHEGSWNANTGNGYYGGLQMDYSFMSSYGAALLRAKGTANNWTPLEQMWVAERAYSSGRGFKPWPNTARRCGLL